MAKEGVYVRRVHNHISVSVTKSCRNTGVILSLLFFKTCPFTL